MWQAVGPIVVVVVVVVAVLFVEWLVATADTAVHQVLACSAVGQCSALGWDVSVAPSDVGYPSGAVGAVVPYVVCSAAIVSPN